MLSYIVIKNNFVHIRFDPFTTILLIYSSHKEIFGLDIIFLLSQKW